MSTRRLVSWIALLSIFAMAARISMDTDTWWHLRAGEWMVTHRAILQQDAFSYTRYGEPWDYPGWIVEVPMYLIYTYFGPGGLNIWTAAMVLVAFCFLWDILKGGPFLKAFLIVLAAAASGVYWSARPHLLTFVFSAATLWALEKYRCSHSSVDRRRLYWLPVIMIAWANSHGGFVVGFILWGIFWIAEQITWIVENSYLQRIRNLIRKPQVLIQDPDFILWTVGLLMVVAVCFNPSGPKLLAYPFKTIAIGALKEYIQEWQSPDFHSLSVQPFLWLFLLVLGSVGISRHRIVLSDFLLVTVFAYLGFLAGRNIALFSLPASLVISRHISVLIPVLQRKYGGRIEITQNSSTGYRLINILILLLICAAVIAKVSLTYPSAVNFKEFEKFLPVKAAAFLNQSEMKGRLFNSYNWGGYLLWSAPKFPVFIDGRTDLYDDEIIQEWLKVVQVEEGWENVLEHYEVNQVIIESDSYLAKTLEKSGGWSNVYRDPVAVIYIRKGVYEQ